MINNKKHTMSRVFLLLVGMLSVCVMHASESPGGSIVEEKIGSAKGKIALCDSCSKSGRKRPSVAMQSANSSDSSAAQNVNVEEKAVSLTINSRKTSLVSRQFLCKDDDRHFDVYDFITSNQNFFSQISPKPKYNFDSRGMRPDSKLLSLVPREISNYACVPSRVNSTDADFEGLKKNYDELGKIVFCFFKAMNVDPESFNMSTLSSLSGGQLIHAVDEVFQEYQMSEFVRMS